MRGYGGAEGSALGVATLLHQQMDQKVHLGASGEDDGGVGPGKLPVDLPPKLL